jgi:hypothetical protein
MSQLWHKERYPRASVLLAETQHRRHSVGYRPEKRSPNGPGNDVKAGEFTLGCENEYSGQFTASPHLKSPDADHGSILPAGDLGRNGTYLVVRQMEQNVAGFWNMMRESVRDRMDRKTWRPKRHFPLRSWALEGRNTAHGLARPQRRRPEPP